MTSKLKTVQIAIGYHSSEDTGAMVYHDTMEMNEDEFRAMTRHFSKILISETELNAVVCMKNLQEMCVRTCKKLIGTRGFTIE